MRSGFVVDVWRLGEAKYRPGQVDDSATAALRRRAHQAIIKVGQDLESFSWNTAVAELMKLRNSMNEALAARNVTPEVWRETLSILALLLAPIAPHVTEEVWSRLGNETSIHLEPWPEADMRAAADESVTMVVQGQRPGSEPGSRCRWASRRARRLDLALGHHNVARHVGESEVRRVIDRRPRLLNIVV